MGTLTGIAVRLLEFPGGRLQVVNANERNRLLLGNLGLDNIFEVELDDTVWQEEKQIVNASLTAAVTGGVSGRQADANHREFLIEAHESLCDAHEANRLKFQDVLDCLKRERESQPA